MYSLTLGGGAEYLVNESIENTEGTFFCNVGTDSFIGLISGKSLGNGTVADDPLG